MSTRLGALRRGFGRGVGVVAAGLALVWAAPALGQGPDGPGSAPLAPVPTSVPFTVKDPNTSPLPADPQLADAIRQGYQIANATPRLAGEYVGNALACSNCHLAAGQREWALPLVGVAPQYPEYSARAGRTIDLAERLQSCFLRSEAGTAPPVDSPQLQALVAYISWLGDGQPPGVNPPWRNADTIAERSRIPIDRLDPARGATLYAQQCALCHGADGDGVGESPPVWGPRAYADGAGLARVYTLAGFIQNAMPYTSPGSLTVEEAQQIAAFIDSQPRPVYAGKAQDYPDGQVPVDAVYYPQRYPENPLRR